jgi:hypothetical protein
VYDLVNKINVEDAERRIAEYQAENSQRIELRQAQRAEEERRAEQRIRAEKERVNDLNLALLVGAYGGIIMTFVPGAVTAFD